MTAVRNLKSEAAREDMEERRELRLLGVEEREQRRALREEIREFREQQREAREQEREQREVASAYERRSVWICNSVDLGSWCAAGSGSA